MTTIQENSNNLISNNKRMIYDNPSIESNDKNLEMKNQPDLSMRFNYHIPPFQPIQRENSNSSNKYSKIKIIPQINNNFNQLPSINQLPQINQGKAQFSPRNYQLQSHRNCNNKQNQDYLYYQQNQNGNNLAQPPSFKINQFKDEPGIYSLKNQGYYQENYQFRLQKLEENQQSSRSPRSINSNIQNQLNFQNLKPINSKTQGEKSQGYHLEKQVENNLEKCQRIYQIRSNIQSKFQFQNKKTTKGPTQDVENAAKIFKEPIEISKENNDDDTVFQTIEQPCRNCSLVTEEKLISLSCLHQYHFSCFQEQIQLQLNRANLLRLECQCGKQIKLQIIQQISGINIDNLFERQLEQIYKYSYKQMWKCRSCNFFCVNSKQKFREVFCPQCSNHEIQ